MTQRAGLVLRALFGLVVAGSIMTACQTAADPSNPADIASDVVNTAAATAVPADSTPPTTAPGAEDDKSVEPAPEPTSQPSASPQLAPPSPAPALVVDDVEPVVFDNDYATSIAPIFAQHCANCHNAQGPGAAHWQLEQASDLVATHEWIASVVATGYMPPWPASELSVPFHNNRSLRPDEIEAIAQWSTAGAPLDVADTTPVIASQGVIALDADVEIAPREPFQGSSLVPDDYRCLIYDLDLETPRWLTGFEFVPDQTETVHHAIGYLAPAQALAQAERLSDRDDLGGWQCYGGSGLRAGDELFLGWAPGQLPTEFPDGAGILAQPGDFIVLQIHYHFDSPDVPEDASTIRLAWSDEQDLDAIEVDSYIGPAEIPCSADESGPLCDRNTALQRAYEQYGIEGVLADGINRVCGATPADFAAMTDGIASSTCTIPVRRPGEIVAVFGHEHEIGKSIRLTLNPGRATERILLDIPDWSFDWQFNYYPTESIVLERGDVMQLDCVWDRSRRSSDLEPAYVLWADGTNDEMCFATISTRPVDATPTAGKSLPSPDADPELGFTLPAEIESCLQQAGIATDRAPTRGEINTTVDAMFNCADPAQIGQAMTSAIADNFGGLVDTAGLQCLAAGLAQPDAVRSILTFALDDATEQEREPIGELAGDCVLLSSALAAFGLTIPDSAVECIDQAGRALIVQATIDGDLPEEQTLFGAINPCLVGE